jgi:Na+-driven multidrug efflux pump
MLIYGRMGVGALAAMTVIFSVQRLLIGLFAALGIASSIVVGHELGARRPEGAWRSAWSSLVVSVGVAALGSAALLVFRDPILSVFPAIEGSTLALTHSVYWILPVDLLLRASNIILILGALRAGGDVRFCLTVDGVCAWLVGLPLAYAAANFWGLPLAWVFAFALLEEGTKLVACLHRVFRRLWLKRLIEDEVVVVPV